jgi:hypothetical protein
MLKKWLEPAISKRVFEVSDDCCMDERVKELYTKFMGILNEPNNFQKDSYEVTIFELENILNLAIPTSVDFAYRRAFYDGMELGNYTTVKK